VDSCALILAFTVFENTMNQTAAATASSSSSSASAAFRFAFVHGQWHADIVGRAREGFLAELARQGFPAEAVDTFEVPGAFEIPLHAKRLAETGRYDAIVASAACRRRRHLPPRLRRRHRCLRA
jgi:hypothetical protein